MIDEFGEVIFDEIDGEELYHYGMPRRSGRYPWGSGENPYQHNSGSFLARIQELKDQGATYTDPDTGKTYTGDTAIAHILGMSTTQLRARKGVAKAEIRAMNVESAKTMREDGKTLQEIADRLGLPNESSVRSLLNTSSEMKMNQAMTTANTLRELVDKKGFIDVGEGAEIELHISKEKLKQAQEILLDEGYNIYGFGQPQLTNPGKQTEMKVLCGPNVTHKEVYAARDLGDIHSIREYGAFVDQDGNLRSNNPLPPSDFSSKRVMIAYGDQKLADGSYGIDRDGMIEIRPGVKDLNLGGSTYAQIRMSVDGTHYMKGMAIYGDPKNFPPGIDVIFHTNKNSSKKMMDFDSAGNPTSNGVFKSLKDDPDNPFGALIRENGQSFYPDPKGKYKYNFDTKSLDPDNGTPASLSPLNKIRQEGDWNDWEKGLPSQFLAKQSMPLIKKQLTLAYADKEAEYDDICKLNNPTIRKHFLKEFGDQCDADAVNLKAASMPGQTWKVIFPVPSLKDNEIYDPTHKDGELVALVRFPHQGTFEIPICRVNNKQPAAKNLLKNAADAIGINHNVADRLSGADFDGDTVLVIPAGKDKATKIISQPALKGLEGFDPKTTYGTTPRDTGRVDEKGKSIFEYINKDGQPIKVMKNTQNEMGRISNLVTDMTLKGATPDELARATRHAQVIIDAEKHHLDYKASERENDISGLKKKYQAHDVVDPITGEVKTSTGASTLISRAKSPYDVFETQGQPHINKQTGEYEWEWEENGKTFSKYTGRSYLKPNKKLTTEQKAEFNKRRKNGESESDIYDSMGIKTKTIFATRESTKMAETKDARTLVSDKQTPQELAYADYANKLKALANRSRKEYLDTPRLKQDKAAKLEYKAEVESLNNKLEIAKLNAPRERQAQIIAYSRVKAKKEANEDMKSEEYKKLKQRELAKARVEVGASGKDTKIRISDREWEAIQKGAISDNQLQQIINKSDPDELRQRATPRNTREVSQAQINRIKAMAASDYTVKQIATQLGLSTSTISSYLAD